MFFSIFNTPGCSSAQTFFPVQLSCLSQQDLQENKSGKNQRNNQEDDENITCENQKIIQTVERNGEKQAKQNSVLFRHSCDSDIVPQYSRRNGVHGNGGDSAKQKNSHGVSSSHGIPKSSAMPFRILPKSRLVSRLLIFA